MNKKLELKDLVLIGIFAVIYLVLMFAVGMIGLIPILFLVYPTIAGIICGPLVLLFMAKEQKPFALFIFGMLMPIVMFLGGHTYIVILISVIIILIAELIRKMGNYNSMKHNIISCAVFSMWIGSSLSQMLFAKEKYIQMCKMMGDEYTKALEKLITYPNLLLVFVGAFIGGLIGAFIGKKLLKKHFERAGIV